MSKHLPLTLPCPALRTQASQPDDLEEGPEFLQRFPGTADSSPSWGGGGAGRGLFDTGDTPTCQERARGLTSDAAAQQEEEVSDALPAGDGDGGELAGAAAATAAAPPALA